MGYVYQKVPEDKCIVLEPHEALLREMNIPTTWAELILVVGISLCSSSDFNGDPVAETITFLNHSSRFTFGIKDSSAILPGFVGSKFIGVSTAYTTQSVSVVTTGTTAIVSGAGTLLYGLSTDDTSIAGTPSGSAGLTVQSSEDDTASTNYFGWYAIRLTRTGTNSLTISSAKAINQTDASYSAMNSFVDSAVWGSVGAWSATGSATWPIRHFFIRAPFNNNRLRIHNYGYRLIS